MPRRARSIEGGLVYHILNRSNARMTLFEKDEDYAAFERVLKETHEMTRPGSFWLTGQSPARGIGEVLDKKEVR